MAGPGSELPTDGDWLPIAPVTIGDPGRAASEVRPGAPVPPFGWPDTAVDTAKVAGLQVRAASRRGLMHQSTGTPRQDAYALAPLGGGCGVVAAVCDGVGSLPDSHEAARVACARLTTLLARSGAGEVDWAAALAAASAAIETATAAGSAATTAVAGVFRSTPDGPATLELAWVGDSSARLLRAGRWYRLGVSDRTDEDVSDGGTAALPARPIRHGSWTGDLLPGDAVFLMTDGVDLPLGSGTGSVGRVLAQLWAAPPEMLDFAAQVGFARRTFDDDRTVVGVWLPLGPGSDGGHAADG